MKITIQGWETTLSDNDKEIVIEEHKNENFVSITINNGFSYTVPIDDLMSALIAFDSKRARKSQVNEIL